MKILLVRSMFVAVLIGAAIGFANEALSIKGAIKYNPPLSQAELHKMDNLTVKDIEATLANRRVRMTRWEWLADSIHDFYFWKQAALGALLPSFGVFLGCFWVGLMTRKQYSQLP